MLATDPAGVDSRALLRGAQVFDLSHSWFTGMPVAPVHMPYMFSLARRHGDAPREDGSCTANEMIVLCAHSGTHIDALGHVSRHGKLSGGLDADATQSGGYGLKELGAEHIGPIATNGVLLDIAALHEVDELPAGYEITPADMDTALEQYGLTVEPGDVVLMRTGWAQRWPDVASFINSEHGTPGPGLAAANWLADHQVVATGTDTLTYEVVRPEENVRPVHARLLVEAGVYLFETLNLEELARSGTHSFFFVAAPLKLVGATASPVAPLAFTWPRSNGAGPAARPNANA